MGQSSLIEFDKNQDNFKNRFESEYIRQIDFESDTEEDIFFYKKLLETKLIPNVKKKRLEFGVMVTFLFKGKEIEDFNECSVEIFEKKEKALEFFNDSKEELEWLRKSDKENNVFDGRRYFWVVENDKILKRI